MQTTNRKYEFTNSEAFKSYFENDFPQLTAQYLFIGKHGDPQFPYWFNGVLDEVRIYKGALCEGEVKMLYNLKN